MGRREITGFSYGAALLCYRYCSLVPRSSNDSQANLKALLRKRSLLAPKSYSLNLLTQSFHSKPVYKLPILSYNIPNQQNRKGTSHEPETACHWH